MTGIVVDIYKNEIFVFADGRVTNDDYVFTDKDDKIHKLGERDIITMTGGCEIIDQAIELIRDGNLSIESVKEITGSGIIIYVTDELIHEWTIDNVKDTKDSPSNNGTATYKHKVLPLFFGSGTEALAGAYELAQPRKAKNCKDYQKSMEGIFLAASKRVSSMGPLHQTESFKLPKRKNKS